MPTLFPPAKPRFLSVFNSVMSGNAADIRETESSVEPLSTTMTVRCGYVHALSAPRHSMVCSHPFQFRTMQVTRGVHFISLTLTSRQHFPEIQSGQNSLTTSQNVIV